MVNSYERKLEVNGWLVKARWFYLFGVALIAFVSQWLKRYHLSTEVILLFVGTGAALNFLNYLTLLIARKYILKRLLGILSLWQIVMELALFAMIFYFFGGLEGVGALFFFLPIMSAGFLYSSRGSITVALLSGFSVALIVMLEYSGVLKHFFMFDKGVSAYSDFRIALTYVIPYSVFYVIIGIYSGHISSLLIKREELLDEQTEKLDQESKYRKNEWSQLDKTAKLLVRRDKELLTANRELDKKVQELQRSEAAMLKAFSDLKEGKRLLEIEKNRTSAMIENIIDPIIVINNQNRIELLNQSARTVLNFKEEYGQVEIDSKDNYSMENFKSIIGNEYKVEEVVQEEGAERVEEVIIKIEGQETNYKVVTAKVIDVHHEQLGVMKIFYNLTRERMLDKLKSEFISIAAHQLRTPLSAIKWVIKMVLDGDAGPLTEDQQQLLKKGYKSNERIIILVNDMLNVSRIEEGRFGYVIQKDDLIAVLDTILDSLTELITKKFIKLTVDKDPDFPSLNIDAKKMQLVLQNLIENAIKYTPDYGKIHIQMKRDGQFVKVSVQDNGIGIPAADQVKLFSKFYRAENALRLQTEGSGLGLFIVRNIVKKHGGDITFESEEGIGTKFTVILPIDYEPKSDNAVTDVKVA